MSICFVSNAIQVVLVIIAMLVYIYIDKKSLGWVLSMSLILVFLSVFFLFRLDVVTRNTFCYVKDVGIEGYIYPNLPGVSSVLDKKVASRLGISSEILEDLSPLDRVELKVCKNLSDVSFWDILLCRDSRCRSWYS